MKMKKINEIRRCRLCASEEDFNSFVNIFKEDMELDAKITKLLPVVVMPWDPMSHKICPNCIEKLNFFNDFYEATVKADRFLRTLQPSAPENDLNEINPLVEIDAPISGKNTLKLPPKKRQGLSPSSHKRKDTSQKFSEQHRNELNRKKKLNGFIVSQLTSKDSILTCRECYRTFTKRSSAFSHPCVGIEDCEEEEEEEEEKCLPPLKIRLFSIKSGLFVCYICQAPFVEKIKVIEHIKRHIGEAKWEEEKRSNGKQKRKRKERCLDESDEDEDWNCRKKMMSRKRRKSSGIDKKKGKTTEETVEEWERSGLYSSTKKNDLERFENTEVEEDIETPLRVPEEAVEMIENSERDNTEVEEVENEKEERIKVLVREPEDGKSVELPENFESDYTKVEEKENKNEECTEVLIRLMEDPIELLENPKYDNTKVQEVENKNEDCIKVSIPEDEKPAELPENPENNPNTSKQPETSDEVTILEVINNKTATSLSSCTFCDKIFATKETLITHQNKHKEGVEVLKAKMETTKIEESFLCSFCAMFFTKEKTLLEHEEFFHVTEVEGNGYQKKIRIALDAEFPDVDVEQECQVTKGRGIITITLTASEKKFPEIE